MKRYRIAATVVLWAILSCSSNAYLAGLNQSKAEDHPAPKTTTQEPAVKSAQPTSYVLVELNKTLKANKLKPGDRITAKVSQDVISHGKVIIPEETEMVGHVTEVRARDAENSESRLGIVFDKILLKHFHDINIQAVVQSVAAPVIRRSRVDEPSQMLPPSLSGGRPRGSGTMGTASGSNAGRASISNSAPATSQSSTNDSPVFTAPLSVKQSPSGNAASGASAADLNAGAGGSPLSVGTPQGVIGIKNLSLSSSSAETPGPVIVSNTGNVKLEDGTQILLHVLSVETPNPPAR